MQPTALFSSSFCDNMSRDSKPIALRNLMSFSRRYDTGKPSTSYSMHNTDEDPLLLDEEARV